MRGSIFHRHYGYRPGVGPGAGGAPITWLLKASFEGPDLAAGEVPAELGAPYVEIGGPLTIVDTEDTLSISNSAILPVAATTGYRDPWIYDEQAWDRAAGLMLRMDVKGLPATGSPLSSPALGWSTTLTDLDRPNVMGLTFNQQNSVFLSLDAAGNGVVLAKSYTPNEYQRIAVVLRTVGAFVFVNTELVWIVRGDATAALYPVNFARGANNSPAALDLWGVRQLTAPFDTDTGIASVAVDTPVSGTAYTATANAIHDLTVTAPNPLTGECALEYRVTDDDNKWRAYFNDSGAFRLDSVLAGTPTNRINVAGAIAAGDTRTMRVITNSTLHDAYTYSGAVPTKRGGQITLAHQDAAAAIKPVAGAGWVLGALHSYPTTSPVYAELDHT